MPVGTRLFLSPLERPEIKICARVVAVVEAVSVAKNSELSSLPGMRLLFEEEDSALLSETQKNPYEELESSLLAAAIEASASPSSAAMPPGEAATETEEEEEKHLPLTSKGEISDEVSAEAPAIAPETNVDEEAGAVQEQGTLIANLPPVTPPVEYFEIMTIEEKPEPSSIATDSASHPEVSGEIVLEPKGSNYPDTKQTDKVIVEGVEAGQAEDAVSEEDERSLDDAKKKKRRARGRRRKKKTTGKV
jgi:hypothetical protein